MPAGIFRPIRTQSAPAASTLFVPETKKNLLPILVNGQPSDVFGGLSVRKF